MKITKLILVILLFFPGSCGYKILNSSDNYKLKIVSYKLDGNKKINNFLDQNFKKFKTVNEDLEVFKIKTKSELKRQITSKNSSGEALTHKLEIIINLDVFKNDELIDNTTFRKNTNYNNLNSKFELKQYENILIQDLTKQIIFQINLHLNSIK